MDQTTDKHHMSQNRIFLSLTAVLLAFLFCFAVLSRKSALPVSAADASYIKWVDFGVTATAMSDAMALDIESYGTDEHVSWTSLLAYLGAKYGGNFKS